MEPFDGFESPHHDGYSPMPLRAAHTAVGDWSTDEAATTHMFESPFLPLINQAGEDHIFNEDEDEDEEEDMQIIAQQIRLQQQLLRQQEQAVSQHQDRQQKAEEEQRRLMEQQTRDLERLRMQFAQEAEESVFSLESGAADSTHVSVADEQDEDDRDLTNEELQQLMDARSRSTHGSPRGSRKGDQEDSSRSSSRLAVLPRRSLAKHNARSISEANKQGQRIREATAATRAAEEDVLYWSNRVKMLKHEMDKTIVKIEEARRLNDITDVSAMLNERTKQALEDQAEYQRRLQEAQRALNRQRRRELKERCWQARLGHFEENWGAREQAKLEQENRQRIIGHVRWEELQDNIRRKEEVQQQKMVALMKRVQDRAEKEQETHRRFEDRIARCKDREGQKNQEALALIKESAILMHHLQALKEEHSVVASRVDPNLISVAL